MPKPIASCSECYSRKQKCDRKYPCNNCIRRRRSEICSYKTKAQNDAGDAANVITSASASSNQSDDERDGLIQDRSAKRGWKQASGTDAEDVDERELGHKGKSIRYTSSADTPCSSGGMSPDTPASSVHNGSIDDSGVAVHLGYADYSQNNLAGLMKHASVFIFIH